MKHIILLLCLLAGSTTFAQEGVNFRDITFDEALEQAKAENKLVFMDCYTSWCGPCKSMTTKVFPQKAAGDYFNPRFVCVKYDMEKGAGVELAKKFEVHAYPTFIIIRPDGIVQHRLVGGDNLDGFIERVNMGLDEKTSLLSLNQTYEKGAMNNIQLMSYQIALAEAGNDDQAAKVYDELVDRLSDQEKTQKEYWPLYTDEICVIGSPMFNFLLTHLSAIRQNVGEKTVDRFLYEQYSEALQNHIAGYAKEDTPPVDMLAKDINSFRINGQENLEKMLALAGPVSRKEIDNVARMIEQRIPQANSYQLKVYAFGFRAILWNTQKPYPKQYGKLGKKLSRQLIAVMENKASALSSEDIVNYSVILSCFGDLLEQKDYARLASLGERILPTLPDDDNKRSAEWTVKGFKKHAQEKK